MNTPVKTNLKGTQFFPVSGTNRGHTFHEHGTDAEENGPQQGDVEAFPRRGVRFKNDGVKAVTPRGVRIWSGHVGQDNGSRISPSGGWTSRRFPSSRPVPSNGPCEDRSWDLAGVARLHSHAFLRNHDGATAPETTRPQCSHMSCRCALPFRAKPKRSTLGSSPSPGTP